jgi:hypothetical protein
LHRIGRNPRIAVDHALMASMLRNAETLIEGVWKTPIPSRGAAQQRSARGDAWSGARNQHFRRGRRSEGPESLGLSK